MSTNLHETLPISQARPIDAEGPPSVTFTEEADRKVERLLVLEPGRAARDYWADLWHYRELFAILAWRDIAVRYKQTVIGVAWAVIRPFLTMVIFTIVFGKLANLPSDGGVPYPVLVFAGMLPWFLFSSILTDASNSLVENANLVTKVYFPRLIVPASAVGVALVDLGLNLLSFSPLWRGIVSCRTGRSLSCRRSSCSQCLLALAPRSSYHR